MSKAKVIAVVLINGRPSAVEPYMKVINSFPNV